MTDIAAQIELLFEKAKIYANTSVNLYKLEATDSIAGIVSNLVSKALLILVVSTFLLFLNIGLSLYIGELLESSYLGFFIICGFYLLVAVFLFVFKKRCVETPVNSMIIKKLQSTLTKNIHE